MNDLSNGSETEFPSQPRHPFLDSNSNNGTENGPFIWGSFLDWNMLHYAEADWQTLEFKPCNVNVTFRPFLIAASSGWDCMELALAPLSMR